MATALGDGHFESRLNSTGKEFRHLVFDSASNLGVEDFVLKLSRLSGSPCVGRRDDPVALPEGLAWVVALKLVVLIIPASALTNSASPGAAPAQARTTH